VLAAEFTCWTVAELLQQTKKAKLLDTAWLMRLAISVAHVEAADEPEVAELVRARLKSRNFAVRAVAADAAFALLWPELLPALIEARKRETILGTIKMLGATIGELRQREQKTAK
jgi:hypothetical protein